MRCIDVKVLDRALKRAGYAVQSVRETASKHGRGVLEAGPLAPRDDIVEANSAVPTGGQEELGGPTRLEVDGTDGVRGEVGKLELVTSGHGWRHG